MAATGPQPDALLPSAPGTFLTHNAARNLRAGLVRALLPLQGT